MQSQVLPKTRKAWRVVRRGSPIDALRLEHDTPMPKLDKDEIMVKVEAAALNPVDHKFMKLLPNLMGRPCIAGYDFAGIVADPNGTKFQVGEKVWGWNPHNGGGPPQGAMAEYIKVPTVRLGRRPDGMSATDAAGFAVTGFTAMQGLLHDFPIEKGQRVFINGGSTSVGRFAIQLAKWKGCTVTASCSPSKVDAIRALGADEVLDYTKEPLATTLANKKISAKYNVFLEAVGLPAYDLYTSSPQFLQPGGAFVSVGTQGHDFASWMEAIGTVVRGMILPRWLGGVSRTFKITVVKANQSDMDLMERLIAEGHMKPQVDSVFAFEDLVKAYDRILTNKTNGKVVITVPV